MLRRLVSRTLVLTLSSLGLALSAYAEPVEYVLHTPGVV